MGQALYRKYRSKALGEIVGQEHITKALEGSLKAGRISHAYLFTGPRGVGKTSIARILAHEINKLPYNSDTQLDIIEIDAASNRRIDDIRDLRDKVHIAPVSAKYKVYIIDEVHMLTGESFNALLKTLEEPPEHVIFILATTEVHKLPATIVSRTQRYSFRPMDTKKGIKHLKEIAKKENITIDDEAVALLVEHGAGSFRDSISLLDQLANVSEGKITVESVETTLGLAPRSAVTTLLTHVLGGDHKAIIATLAQLEESGTSIPVLVNQLLAAARQLATDNPRLFLLVDRLLDVPKAHNPHLKLLTTLLDFALNLSAIEHKNSPALSVAKPVLAISADVTTVRPQPGLQAEKVHKKELTNTKTEIATLPVPTSTTTQQSGNLGEITPEQWNVIAEKVRQTNPPLFAVVRQAEPTFNAEKQLLTLGFRFALHGKKLEDPKHKTKLAAIIADILGTCPEIVMAVNKEATPPEFANSEPEIQPITEVDEQTKSVLDMMGGGEVISA